MALFAILALLDLLAPKVAAIARTTAKEALSQPLFYVLLAIGIFAILVFPFVPYNTFGEDIKMLKAEGLTLNESKTRIQRRNRAQTVTGIVVNEGPRAPRKLVRKLRAIAHQRGAKTAWFGGMCGYVGMIHPDHRKTIGG